MNDIVERLRGWSEGPNTYLLTDEAADEIDQLRTELAAERLAALVEAQEADRLRAELTRLRAMVFTNGDRKMTMEGRVFTANADGFISDQNFDFDAGMQVTGDFVDDEKRQYAEMIVSVLNATNPALPHDDSALRERLKAERERFVGWRDAVAFYVADHCVDGEMHADIIRAMGDE